jgi:putative DNA methylase
VAQCRYRKRCPEPFPLRGVLEDCAADTERKRIFTIIEDLVKNTTNVEVLEKARAKIWQSWRRACAAHVDYPRARELFDRTKPPHFMTHSLASARYR